MKLSLDFYTQWYWKIDLHNLMHFLSLRADPHAQSEIRAYAEIMLGTVEIRGINDLMFVLQTAKPGTDVKVTFVRDGKQQTVTATYGVPRSKR